MGKNQDPGSGINIPDPQHWMNSSFFLASACTDIYVRMPRSKLQAVLCRMWGRLIGAVFYIPAGVMWARGMFSPALKKRVVGMGCLLAFQVIVFLLRRIRDILVRILIRASDQWTADPCL
jgi:hypothetical protein